MCVYIFIKVYITAQPGPIILVCMCVRIYIYIYIKVHITAQSGPIILVFVCVCVYLLKCI